MCQLLPCILIGVEVSDHLEPSRNTPATWMKKPTHLVVLAFYYRIKKKNLNSSLPLKQVALTFCCRGQVLVCSFRYLVGRQPAWYLVHWASENENLLFPDLLAQKEILHVQVTTVQHCFFEPWTTRVMWFIIQKRGKKCLWPCLVYIIHLELYITCNYFKKESSWNY